MQGLEGDTMRIVVMTTTTRKTLGVLAVALALTGSACFRSAPPSATPSGSPPATSAQPAEAPAEDAVPPEPAPEATPMPSGLAPLIEPWKGDLDGMVKRRVVRILTVQNPILYFVDRGRELGSTRDLATAFEKQLNDKLGRGLARVFVVILPVARNELIPRLLSGQGDIIAAGFAVTRERKEQVEFSQPMVTDVSNVLVTGPDTPPVASLDDLSGREVYVRPSSSYAEQLKVLNQRLKGAGKPSVRVRAADEVLEDGDILEMVSAGLVPATVVNSYVADLYVQVFPNLRKSPDVALETGGEIAWAFRKGSPKLAAAVNEFVGTHKQGSLAGNMLIKKYLKSNEWVKNARSAEDVKRFRAMVQIFRKYSTQYKFDYLLMAAQGYQESQLDQGRRSKVGAVGVMQVMPKTARDKSVAIPDIQKLDSNIHAGIKYNRWMVDHFFNEPGVTPLNRQLFALASYNAGPGKIASLRKEAAAQGLDPNRWFNNVELIAAKRIGRETVQYVSNIYKYYVAYQMVAQQSQARAKAKQGVKAR